LIQFFSTKWWIFSRFYRRASRTVNTTEALDNIQVWKLLTWPWATYVPPILCIFQTSNSLINKSINICFIYPWRKIVIASSEFWHRVVLLKNTYVSEILAAYSFRVEDYRFGIHCSRLIHQLMWSWHRALSGPLTEQRHRADLRLSLFWVLVSEEKFSQMFKGVGMYEVCYTCIKFGRTFSHNELVDSLLDVGNTAIGGNGLVIQAVSQSRSHFKTDDQTPSLSWCWSSFRGS
jgi:hypothetical protein